MSDTEMSAAGQPQNAAVTGTRQQRRPVESFWRGFAIGAMFWCALIALVALINLAGASSPLGFALPVLIAGAVIYPLVLVCRRGRRMKGVGVLSALATGTAITVFSMVVIF